MKSFSIWWKTMCDTVPGLMVCTPWILSQLKVLNISLATWEHFHQCHKMKTGSFKVPHPKTTCSDGFLSVHKEVPYLLPYGLTITTTSKDRHRTLGDLLLEAFVTVAT